MSCIVFVAHPLSMGGTEKTILNLSRFLSQHFRVYIVVINFSGRQIKPAYTFPSNVKIFDLVYDPNPLSYCKAVCEINRTILSIANPVVLAFLSVPSILTLTACLFRSVPIICSERTHPQFTQGVSFHWRLLRRIIYPLRVSRLVLQTPEIARAFRFVESSKIVVIPNAGKSRSSVTLDRSQYKNNFRPAMRLLFLGRHEYQKGVDLLIEAIDYLAKKDDGMKLDVRIVGSGSLTGSYSKQIAKKKLAHMIQLLPALREADNAIIASHYVIMPSRWEGLSNVLVESLSNGVPVIASPQASAGYIKDGVNGFIINELSAVSVAASISRAYYSAEKYHTISVNAHESSLVFEAGAINTRWLKLICSLQKS